jgi:hypothetical protein
MEAYWEGEGAPEGSVGWPLSAKEGHLPPWGQATADLQQG